MFENIKRQFKESNNEHATLFYSNISVKVISMLNAKVCVKKRKI